MPDFLDVLNCFYLMKTRERVYCAVHIGKMRNATREYESMSHNMRKQNSIFPIQVKLK